MVYGTIRKKVQKTIIQALQKKDKLRYGELSKIIVNEKKVCSDRIFRETLGDMTHNKIIKKLDFSRNITYYTMDFSIMPFTDVDAEEFIKIITELEEETEKIFTLISSDQDDIIKSEEITKHLQLLSLLELQSMILSNTIEHPKLKKSIKKIIQCKKNIIDKLFTESTLSTSKVISMIYADLFVESIKYYPEVVESFVNNINNLMGKRKN